MHVGIRGPRNKWNAYTIVMCGAFSATRVFVVSAKEDICSVLSLVGLVAVVADPIGCLMEAFFYRVMPFVMAEIMN